jgi:drug/metabolite transporter (DMT)-like permease
MSEKNRSYLLIAVLAIIWGSSFILMKRALDVYTPYQVGAMRVFIAFLALSPVFISRFKTIERSKWKYFFASGFLGNGIPSVLFPLAETRISSALAGMINSLTPIFTLIVGMLLFGMKVGRNRIFGLSIGLLGAILLITGQTGGEGITDANAFALLVVLAAVCYAFSVNILRYKLAATNALTNTAFALLCAGIPMGIYVFSTDFVERTSTIDGAGFSFLCIALLGLLSTAFSTVLFNQLIKSSGALAASSVTYLIPLVAVLWGLYDHEKLGLMHVTGLAAILLGVYIVNLQGKKTAYKS